MLMTSTKSAKAVKTVQAEEQLMKSAPLFTITVRGLAFPERPTSLVRRLDLRLLHNKRAVGTLFKVYKCV